MDDAKADLKRGAEERRAIRRTTVEQRCAYTAARRAANTTRDAERLRYAQLFAAQNQCRIPPEDGYLRVAPGVFDVLTEAVIADGNALIDRIGHDGLLTKGGKSDFIARGFLPEAAFAIDSPYMRLALDERIVGPIAAYLGVVPVLTDVDMWYSVHHRKEPKVSQLWHMDTDDTTLIKLWVHLSHVDERSGPLTALSAKDSGRLAEAVRYDYADGYRVPDDRVNELFGPDDMVRFEGPRGTVAFVDTGRCFHFGSRLSPGGEPRRVVILEYQTPYSFKFTNYRKEAPYRALASTVPSDLQRLVLGDA